MTEAVREPCDVAAEHARELGVQTARERGLSHADRAAYRIGDILECIRCELIALRGAIEKLTATR